MTQPGRRSTYVPHIDGLRAVAVLSVILYHISERWLPGGFSGVDVFFAISGFVVSASVAELPQMRPFALFGYFYARRIRRIVPALVVCLLATSVLAALFIPYAWLSQANEQTGYYAFFGVSNFTLVLNSNSYFAPQVDFNPYTHTWSLGVEEQFYLLFPPMFAAWMAGGVWRRASAFLFGVGLIASLACAIWLGRTNPTYAFYLLPSRFWELAAGVLLYQALSWRGHPFSEHDQPATLWSRGGAIASAAILVAGLVFSKPALFPYPGALLPVAGTLGLIAFLHGREPRGLIAHLLRNRVVVFIGKISYSLYLWHWPVFVLFRWTSGLESAPWIIAAVVLTFALAIASYYFVEQPARRSEWVRRVPRVATIAAGIVLVVSSAWIATKVTAHAATISLSTVTRNAQDWYPTHTPVHSAISGCTVGVHVASIDAGTAWTLKQEGCERVPTNQPKVFLIGDSHATAYMPLLENFVADTGAEVWIYHNGGCPYLSLQLTREGDSTGCPHLRNAAVADILRRANRGDILFLASLRLARLSSQYSPGNASAAWNSMISANALTLRHRAEKDAIGELTPFASKGLRIVFEAPKPIFRTAPFRCADWFNASNPICAPGETMQRAELERYRKPVLDSFSEIAKNVLGVSVWDPFPILCPGETCSTRKDGRPLFFDGDHISAYANTLLVPSFESYVASLTSGTTAARTP